MKRLLVLSDLHFEFQPDAGVAMCKILERVDADVVVIAGDLCSYDRLELSLQLVRAAFREKPIVYVIGNHECYGASIRDAVWKASELSRSLCIDFLEQDAVEVAGVHFVGCTLWFNYPTPDLSSEWAMNDFHAIRNLRQEVGVQNRTNVEFLAQATRPGDVVVTHHLPTNASVHPRYAGSSLNKYFVCDVEHVIKKQRPALWIHGHTHESVDTRVGETRIVCNPYGYQDLEPNRGFSAKIVEVGQ